MPVRAMGRTNSGTFASRASAAAVHRTGMGSLVWTGRAPTPVGARSAAPGPSIAGIIAVNGQREPDVVTASPCTSGPIRTPSDWTSCVSNGLVSIAIS